MVIDDELQDAIDKADAAAIALTERCQQNLVEPIDERTAFLRKRDALLTGQRKPERQLDTAPPPSVDIAAHIEAERALWSEVMAEAIALERRAFNKKIAAFEERLRYLEAAEGEIERQLGAADFRAAQANMRAADDDDDVVDLRPYQVRRHA